VADDAGPETARRSRSLAPERAVTLPIAAVASLLSAMLAGGGGSYMTGASVTGAMREGQIRLEGRLDQLHEQVRRIHEDQRAALGRMEATDRAHDDRIRALELDAARRSAGAGPR
jgi:hypothetical protein